MTAWIVETLAGLASNPVAVFAVIFALTFVLEDAVAVAAGLLAGRMAIDPVLGVAAVIAGTVAGDVALHAAGRWLADTRLVARLRAADNGRIERRLRKHGLVAVAIARFIPGTRLPIFLGSGLVRLPSFHTTLVITATALVWTPIVFGLSYGAGEQVLEILTPTNLALSAALVAAVAFAPRLFTKRLGMTPAAALAVQI